jgi:uncharacterized membrane protein
VHLVVSLPHSPADELPRFLDQNLVFLVLSGLATGLSWLSYFHALQVGPASRVAPIDKLNVALVIVFGALFLGEGLTWARVAGGLLIVTGASASHRAAPSPPECPVASGANIPVKPEVRDADDK